MASREEPKKKQVVPTASAILDDGTIVELVYRSDLRRTFFALYSAGRWTLQDAIDIGPDFKLVPFSPNNNLIKNDVVLLPSEARIYGSEAQLVADIRAFVHRYVDFGESFENVATHYVLLTWLYDAFNELPYLRLRGDYGSGKTRALLTIGSLCYKAFFASGASTVSPIFHTLDAFRGTLIFDEADYRFSDERAEIVKARREPARMPFIRPPSRTPNKYVIRFDRGQTPPVEGFWSITMYDSQYFFVANPINRYSISPRQNLKSNQDGSVDIYVQKDSPGADKESNWLPAPAGKFILMLRMYWPNEHDPSILSETWTIPAVKKAG